MADLHDIVAVAAGYTSSYALSADGSLWVWGSNSFGELGLNSTTFKFLTPQHLLPPPGYAFISIAAAVNYGGTLATLTTIPEPSSVCMPAIAAMGLLRRARRGGVSRS